MRARLALVAAVALALVPTVVAAPAQGRAPRTPYGGADYLHTAQSPSAIVAFLPPMPHARALALLAAMPGVRALGVLDATHGSYNQRRALLDLTQGTQLEGTAYSSGEPPPIAVLPEGTLSYWSAVLTRARGATGEVEPGLLAQSVTGGAAYVSAGSPGVDAVLAAGRTGRIAAISAGPATTLMPRVWALEARFRFVVVDLPSSLALATLVASRAPGQLMLLLERPLPAPPRTGPRLLAVGAAGLDKGIAGQLGSATTRLRGLVAGNDVAPTVLHWLGIAVPAAMEGKPMSVGGARDPAGLRSFDARLHVVEGRRNFVIAVFMLAWLGLALVAGLVTGRRGVRIALRHGALAAFWSPCTIMLAAALRPSRGAEAVTIVVGAFALAAVTDRLLPWPRGPIVAAAAMLVAHGVDLARGSPLIATSLLGPNPIYGSRFYGVGNEMEAALPIVLFAGLAAALPQRGPDRRSAWIFALTGLLLTSIVAWGKLGADVGALFTIGGGTAAGTVALLPGGATRRALLMACAVPIAGLAALAALDLVSGAGGHYTQSILHASSLTDLRHTFQRKLLGAWNGLRHGLMPVITAVCLAGAAYVIRKRDSVLAPVASARPWSACLIGGLAGSIAGSVTNDSGPLLLMVGSFGLASVVAYIRGSPQPSE